MITFNLITLREASALLNISARTLAKLQQQRLAPQSVWLTEAKPMVPRDEVIAVQVARLRGERGEQIRALVKRLEALRVVRAAELLAEAA